MEKLLDSFLILAILLSAAFWLSVMAFIMVVMRTPKYEDFRGEALKAMAIDASPMTLIFTMGQLGGVIPKLDVSVLEHYLNRMVDEGVIHREADDGTGRYRVTISQTGRAFANRLSSTVVN